ncbi:MAG: CHAT domain-containing protein, partial [Gemmatimonadota bacterium]
DPVTTAALVGMQADVEMRAGMLTRADSLYRRALAVLSDRDVPEVSWRLHAGRAEVLAARGRPATAERELELAVAAIESGAAGAAFHRRGSFLLDKWQVYTRLASMQAKRGDVIAAFDTSERMRAGRTLATLAGGRIGQPVDDPSELQTREQDLRRRMREIAARLYATADLPPSLREPPVAPSAADLESELRRTQEEYGQVLDLIRQVDSGYADLVAPDTPGLDQVAARLAADEIFVEYLVGETSTVAVVINSDASDVLTLDIGREQLADLVFFARGAIERERTGSDADLWAAPLRRLYAALVGPIENAGWLDNKTRLVVAPHAELHYLPFQALIRDRDRVSFLVEELAIAYAPSASVWLRLNDRSGARGGDGLLALAPRSGDLPGSEYEVRAITSLLGQDPTVLVGREATEQAFRQAAGDSDLAPGGTGDARLEVHEVYELELDARLVVLSACETGLGAGSQTNAPAGDDWVSLTRAFLSAGADNVVASLWRVEDLATATLMEKFYRELGDGVALPDALAAAQRALIDDPDKAHPFYWAGFSLVGEARGSL